MKKQLRIILIAALLAVGQRAAADEKAQAGSTTSEIPLKDVWAYSMFGTRDIRKLEPDIFDPKLRSHNVSEEATLDKKSLVLHIANYLGSGDIQNPKPARPGFVVLGSDKQALREAHAVLVDDQKAKQSFPADSKLSLVFFSKLFDYHVCLDQVVRRGNKITIKYFFAPNRIDPAVHFALIPLDELPACEFEVDMMRVPCPPKFNDPAYPSVEPMWDALIVCRPFKFTMEK